ncbi:MAG: hypothetical protein IID40_08720, partial [Planctomycetes bacterium]|nr:hypothetical protein [Planctomycetota bacterium]
MKARRDLSLLAGMLGLVLLVPGSTAWGQEFWAARDGVLSTSIDQEQIEAAGLRIGYGDRSVAPDAQGRVNLAYCVDGASSLNVAVNSAAVTGFLGGQILPQGGLSITSSAGMVTLDGLIVVPATPDAHNLRITDVTQGDDSGLLLYRVKGSVN